MALVLSDRTQETSISGGTEALTLLGPCFSCISFATGVGVSNTTYYSIVDTVTGDWEVGLGTLSSAETLTRTAVFASSNSDTLVNFQADNVKNVFVAFPAEHTIVSNAVGSVTVSGDLSVKGVGYQWPSSQGSANTYLSNNGSGTLTWSDLGTGSNTNGSIIIGNSTGGISEVTNQTLVFDELGTLAGLLNLATTLYVGDWVNNTSSGTIALWDDLVGDWLTLTANAGNIITNGSLQFGTSGNTQVSSSGIVISNCGITTSYGCGEIDIDDGAGNVTIIVNGEATYSGGGKTTTVNGNGVTTSAVNAATVSSTSISTTSVSAKTMALSTTTATVSGSSGGTATFSQPFNGSTYKKVMCYCNALNGTASWNFPTSFKYAPMVVAQTVTSSNSVTSATTASCTVSGSTSTGWLVLEGY